MADPKRLPVTTTDGTPHADKQNSLITYLRSTGAAAVRYLTHCAGRKPDDPQGCHGQFSRITSTN